MARFALKSLLKSSSVTASLGLYVILLVVASQDHWLVLAINLVGFSFAISQLTKNSTSNSLLQYLIRFSVGNLITMHVMVQWYAELLPYEIGVHAVLYAAAYYFYFCYRLAASGGNNSGAIVFDFKRTGYFEKKPSIEQQQPAAVNYFRSLIFLTVASLYTAQLTFTTLCTPFMIFDWFLIVKDCSLIYTTWFSSFCTVCGFFSLNVALVAVCLLFYSLKNIKLIK